MPAPTNTTPATAIAIPTLPASITVDLSAVAPGDLTLWWTYTPASTAEVLLSVWGSQDNATAGRLTVYTGTAMALTIYLAIENIAAAQEVPLSPGVTYWFKTVILAFEVATGLPYVLSVLPGPAEAVPPGSLLINDETAGFPATFFSATTGASLQYRHAPAAGENAAMLRTGRSLWEEAGLPEILRLYDSTFTLLATIPVPGRVAQEPIGSNKVDRFYAAVGSAVLAFDANGALEATWTLPAGALLKALEPSPDETILYYVRTVGVGAGIVYRWNLVTDTALADFAPGLADYTTISGFGQEFLVLSDGSVLLTYNRVFVGTPWRHSVIRRYAADTTLLTTYDLGAVIANRLAYEWSADATQFWIWSFLLTAFGSLNGISTFELRRVSDGTILRTLSTAMFSGGAYDPSADPPTTRFGHAPSCAFLVLPLAAPTCPGTRGAPLVGV